MRTIYQFLITFDFIIWFMRGMLDFALWLEMHLNAQVRLAKLVISVNEQSLSDRWTSDVNTLILLLGSLYLCLAVPVSENIHDNQIECLYYINLYPSLSYEVNSVLLH